ncbi:MAG: aminotransferase class V-fold PLP-dependent enzyme [Rhizobacter sp.]|nr:aminotransferase class V-fold PLP-dependent enzyme [Rhizobacter sp.]
MPQPTDVFQPARFGRAMLEHFPLEPATTYLNHGTVGVTPVAVMRARAAILDEIERHPARFLIRELMTLGMSPPPQAPRLRAAAERVAAFLGAAGDGVAFVDNATSGINAVLRSIALAPGDEILVHDQVYGGVDRATAFIAAKRGVTLTRFALPFPARAPQDFVAAVERAITPRTRLALLDHIASETALVMPLAAMAAACRSRGVAVLVDGAHAPGAVEVDIESLGVDWYVANLHKWAFAPRSCGVLWAAPERRQGLHPGVLSWGVTTGDWLREFDWTGTRDPSPWLAAPAALDFMHDVLGVAAMRAHNHALAWESAHRLGERWGRPWTTPESMVGCMVTVPLPERLGSGDTANAQRLRDALFERHAIEVPVIARDGALWARVSLQVYNDGEDVERFAAAIDAL